MPRYHVNYDGEPGACRARTRPCPFGDISEHFSSKEAARSFFEKKMSKEVAESNRWSGRIELDGGFSALIENNRTHQESYGWLRNEKGVAVGMIHWSERDNSPAVLCDIEVREEFRNRGYAKRLIQMVEKKINRQLHTTGGFTPEGFEKLSSLPLYQEDKYYSPGVKYRSMTFVADWNKLYMER